MSQSDIEAVPQAGSAVQASLSVRNFQAADVSRNTARAYESDLGAYFRWCELYDILPVPADPMTVANYIGDRGELVNDAGDWLYAPATIARWVASINKAHAVEGHMPPGKHPDVQRTLSGIRRLHARSPKRVSPLLLTDLRKVLTAIDFQSYPAGIIGHRDNAILLMGFAGAFRRSELCDINIGDVTVHGEDGLHVRLFVTKTDQEGKGFVKALPYGANPITCAPCAFVRWVRVLEAFDTGRPAVMKALRETEINVHVCREPFLSLLRVDSSLPLFRPVTKGGEIGTTTISGHVVNDVVKRRVEDIGFNYTRYGGHSLRAGFITQAFRAGASAHEIMRQTGHRDPATLEIYSRENDPLRQNAVTAIGL